MLKNLTFSAEEKLIARARRKAQAAHTTLNEAFRQWLEAYVMQDRSGGNYAKLMKRLSHVKAGGHFSREQLNERR